MYFVRCADDFVVCFQYKGEANRFRRELQTRLEKFRLGLHPGKTRLIAFGRFAESNRKRRGEGRPATFDFLGFTRYCRRTRRGRFGLGRKPIAKRMAPFLMKGQLIRWMHGKVQETGQWLGQVFNGWLNYLCRTDELSLPAVLLQTAPMDMDAHPKTAIPKGSYSMGIPEQAAAYWPALKIRHPWPDARLVVKCASAI